MRLKLRDYWLMLIPLVALISLLIVGFVFRLLTK